MSGPGVTVAEVVERIRAHAAHPGWSCLLRRAHVAAWVEALRGGGGVRLSPAELRQLVDGDA